MSCEGTFVECRNEAYATGFMLEAGIGQWGMGAMRALGESRRIEKVMLPMAYYTTSFDH